MNPKDLLAKLDEWGDLAPESWRPRPGDKIAGRVVRYDNVTGPYGPCWVAVLAVERDDGPPWLASVWLSHAVLLERFKTLRPRPGELVAIKRLDDREAKDGKPYAVYAVAVDRGGDAVVPDFGAPSAAGEAVESDRDYPF